MVIGAAPRDFSILHAVSVSYTQLLRATLCSRLGEDFDAKAGTLSQLHGASMTLPTRCVSLTAAPLFYVAGRMASAVADAYCDTICEARRLRGLRGASLQLPLATDGKTMPLRILLGTKQYVQCLLRALASPLALSTVLPPKPTSWLGQCAAKTLKSVSYTHLTLPTICSV